MARCSPPAASMGGSSWSMPLARCVRWRSRKGASPRWPSTPPAGASPRPAAASTSASTVSMARRPVLLDRLAGHANTILGIAWNEAGDAIASASVDGSVKYWDVDSRRSRRLRARRARRWRVAHRPRPVAGRPLARRGRGRMAACSSSTCRPRPSPGRCRPIARPRCARSAGARTGRGWRRSMPTASSPSATGRRARSSRSGGSTRAWSNRSAGCRTARGWSSPRSAARCDSGRSAASRSTSPRPIPSRCRRSRSCPAASGWSRPMRSAMSGSGTSPRGSASRTRGRRPTTRWTPSPSAMPATRCSSPAMAASSTSTTSSRRARRSRIDLGSRQIDGAAWSPDDSLIAAVDTEGNLKVWSLAEDKLMVTARIYRAGPAGAESEEEDAGGHLRRMLVAAGQRRGRDRDVGGRGRGGGDRRDGVARPRPRRLRHCRPGRADCAGG